MSKKGVCWRPQAFREMALERLRRCMHIGRLCEELGVSPSTLKKWRRQMESRREAAEPAGSQPVPTQYQRKLRPQAHTVPFGVILGI